MSFSAGSSRLARSIACPICSLLAALPRRGRCLAAPRAEPRAALRHHSRARMSSLGEARSERPLGAEAEKDDPKASRKSGLGSGLERLRNKTKALKQTDAPSRHASTRTILGQSSDLPIRARFAPSPTGYLHLGSLRTALFNNLAVSASNGGAFVLRIEDTDQVRTSESRCILTSEQSRLVGDAEEHLIKDLEWAGLSWDEGPDRGGPHGPYRQSERLDVYKDHVQRLVDNGHAYRCFCSSEQLESQKRELHDAGKPTVYPGTCRSVDPSESDARAAQGEPHVVRFKGDAFGRPKFRDAIYGSFQKKDPEEDFIVMKTDGFPTYHLANVVDDHLMRITHVIRGEARLHLAFTGREVSDCFQEWLISTPKHLALYQAFGWEPPTFAHLGLLVHSDGTKLSKRNDSVNISKYQDQGVFPMALLAWLANLGSSFKSDAKTPRTVDDVADAVSLFVAAWIMAADLTFKFTRGGIKLNLGKLEHFHNKYRDALLGNHIPALAEKEAKLMDHHLTQPMLRELEAITSGSSVDSDKLPKAWQTDLELVPALQANQKQAKKYIHNIFASRQGGFQSPSSLIQQHPYLFWRVPGGLYQSSLAASAPDERILDALNLAIEREDCWDTQGVKVMECIRDRLQNEDIDHVMMHNVLRLVGAGGQDVVSQSTSRMLMLLGRDEWRHRLDVVKTLLRGCDEPGES
ncbi:glutamate-tRNA ligase, mitochondrial [Tolypocladium capitatum]|uniref:glutamate--tRNA ligase n=1 Tax=Tolypocladium capitatum TaxID=45235 RepID=A0A2K3QGP4_9HYPO|nr:glutamate-tRNA ligase, mitochondrial [Tolypocladium capitatum]